MMRLIRLAIAILLLTIILSSCNLPVPKTEQPGTSSVEEIQTLISNTEPSQTPAPPATATPIPAVRIDQAEQALFAGDTDQARQLFQSAALASSDTEIQASALLGIGRAYLEDDNSDQAIENFQALINEHPANQFEPEAWYFLAKSYESKGMYAEAASAFARYSELKPGVLDDLMYQWQAEAWMSAGNFQSAIEAYNKAIEANPASDSGWVSLRIGQAYAALGDMTNAVKTYLDTYASTNNDFVKAQANFLAGQAYLSLGFPEQAYARFQDSVTQFPRSYDTYSGLVILVNDLQAVSEFDRGLVDYYAGQYGYAAEALTRYINSNPELDGSAYYYRGLSRLALSQYEAAIADFQEVVRRFPESPFWFDSWNEIAYTQWAYLEKFDEAAQTLKSFVALQPNSPNAPQALFDSARILERGERPTPAAETWARMIDEYPASELSSRGLFLAGITYYRLKDFEQALSIFQRNAVLSTNPFEQSAALLWVGKSQQALGNSQAAIQTWNQAAVLDPTGYYSERAAELGAGEPVLSPPSIYDLGADLVSERLEAEKWMVSTFNLDPATDFTSLSDLNSVSNYVRANALWAIGLYQMARGEYENTRLLLEQDPLNTYRLMNDLLQKGAYRPAIFAARQVLTQAGMDDNQTLTAPRYFNHIRFGVYFRDQVIEESTETGIHPLLLLSVIRQESFFEPFVTSGADARGLMQIIPSTGQDLANRYNWPPDFTPDDLYIPLVNIRLGAKYLANQRDFFDGNLYVALAAYNGGPGNAKIWNDLAGGDPDLFVEIIRFDETRRYIQLITEFFNLYELFYKR